jgi:exonuclease III
MVLLKHGNFEFHHILSGGFNILENEPKVISEITMADGSIKRNYGEMPKTSIKIKFSQLDKETYTEYMSHFVNNEDTYTYFSPRNQTMLTKKFFVTFPENSMIYGSDAEQTYDEFEIELNQCGEA